VDEMRKKVRKIEEKLKPIRKINPNALTILWQAFMHLGTVCFNMKRENTMH
jgi:hypothetical protein